MEQEEAKRGGQYIIEKLPRGLFSEILRCDNRIVSILGQLVKYCTSNSAETYMGINTKFNGGKQINHTRR